jgi:hypothetical protein
MASDARTDCSTRAPTFSLTAVGEKWNCSFLPDLSLSEVADYLHSAILLNVSEAGEFAARLSVGTRIGQIGGWCKSRAHYLPGPPGFLGGGRRPLALADSTLALMVTWTDINFQLTLRKLARPRRSVITSGTAR